MLDINKLVVLIGATNIGITNIPEGRINRYIALTSQREREKKFYENFPINRLYRSTETVTDGIGREIYSLQRDSLDLKWLVEESRQAMVHHAKAWHVEPEINITIKDNNLILSLDSVYHPMVIRVKVNV